MELKLTFMQAMCATNQFEINGIDANSEDFGEQYDRDTGNAEPYGCGNMKFTMKSATDDILKKYNITAAEYDQIAHELEDGLSFGACGWCV